VQKFIQTRDNLKELPSNITNFDFLGLEDIFLSDGASQAI
jgi:hypothetical protein